MISMLRQLRCHCNPDHDKFSSTVVAIFPNVCLWRRSLCSNLALTLKNCIEPPLYASTAYVVAIWPSSRFNSSVKIWDTCENFFGQMVYRPPLAKNFPYAYGVNREISKVCLQIIFVCGSETGFLACARKNTRR